MKICIISDIHGNALALDCVFQDINKQKVEEIYFLGDAVNYYPDVNTVLTMLRLNDVRCILGNHDDMVLQNMRNIKNESIYRLEHTKDSITDENFNFLSGFDRYLELTFDTKKLLMVHGSPLDILNGYIYPDSDLSDFAKLDYDYVFCGHTHRAMVRENSGKIFANSGSVGMPRDKGDQASYLLFDTETGDCRIKRVSLPKKMIIRTYRNFVHESVIKLLSRK